MRKLSLLLVFLTTTAFPDFRADEAKVESPSDTVRHLLAAIRVVRLPGQATEAAARANAALDIEGLCRKSLGKHWAEMDESGQKEFVSLLARAFEVRAYPRSADFFKDLVIDFRGEAIDGDQARVQTCVQHPDEGRVDIDYELHRTPAGWVIHEVLMDEVPMGANLRNQIRKVLEKEGYPELLNRLRKKLEESSVPRDGDE
ncbi:MAG: ABC transporter substrate-binding protein [Planctomycetes bacterium]|nr:ABC transporter substrate-binding protein [Planctomycetota bacterium]